MIGCGEFRAVGLAHRGVRQGEGSVGADDWFAVAADALCQLGSVRAAEPGRHVITGARHVQSIVAARDVVEAWFVGGGDLVKARVDEPEVPAAVLVEPCVQSCPERRR